MIDSANLLLVSSESFLLLADARSLVLADTRMGQREVKTGAAFNEPRNVVYWGQKPIFPPTKANGDSTVGMKDLSHIRRSKKSALYRQCCRV